MSNVHAAGLPRLGGAHPRPRREELVLWAAVGLTVSLALICAATGRGPGSNLVLAGLVGPLVLVSYQRALLAWPTLLGLILVVILFIPIRRYTVAANMPIELEPYRVLIAVVLALWLCALAGDPEVRWRATGLEAPIITTLLAILISLALNLGAVNAISELVLKQATFFVSYVLVVYFIVSVVAADRPLDRMLRLLTAGGTLLAIAALIEWQTGTNLFNGLGRVMPFLHYVDIGEPVVRGTGVRALGSAQHPIALGAALVMLIPLAVYLYRRDSWPGWLACGGILTAGALSTGSRTAALMLIVLLVVFIWLRRADSVRLIPYLLPLVVVIQIGMPGTLGTFRAILNPSYVLNEQSVEGGTGSGRVADLGPSLEEWTHKPLFGQGFGTRVTGTELQAGGTLTDDSGAQILDNQWLGSLLEIGAVGVLGLMWIFARAVRRLARRARADQSVDGFLAATIAASLAAYAVGLFTYDALAFIQVTFFGFVILAFGSVALRRPLVEPAGPPPTPTP